MTPNEHDELFERLGDIQRDIYVINVKLFGEKDGTGSGGRLVSAEEDITKLAARVTLLERICYGAMGIIGFVYFILEVYKGIKP